APAKEGYTFTGWYTDEACTEAYDFETPVTGDLTLYAGWEENEPEVVAVTGVSLDAAELALTEGDSANLTATVEPENATDKSVTWTSSDEGVATVADGKVTAVAVGEAEITVTTVDGGFTATCVVTVSEKPADSFTVTFVSDGETYQSVNVTSGEAVSEPAAPAKEGYTFTGWYTDEACTEAYDFETPVTGDVTLYAGWEENVPETPVYTVTFNTNGGSEIAPVEVEEGQAVERPADPSNGS
ncbi:InlB B-repeat-containing protein, partial [Pseudoflavonifractor phocaeensis]|uniref:InlB B-repeat-containing protein n=1 Tax=Pseudoflavonifractor phocaeensis TaxID=1870988 RepID=UPI00195BCAC9